MFGIGGPELAVILVLALLFVGPKKLPQVARTVGGAIRDLKRAANMAQSELRETVDELLREADLQDTVNELRRDIELRPEDRLKEVRSDEGRGELPMPVPPTRRGGVAVKSPHPDRGFHIDNDDFEDAIGDELDDELDDTQAGKAPYKELIGAAPRVDRDSAVAPSAPPDHADLMAGQEAGDEVQVAPEPAPQRPAPAMAPVEGTVTWRARPDETGEA